jgi:hypothetical protein
LSATTPLASRLGAAPSKQSFGDPAAPLVPGLSVRMVRLPGIAPGHGGALAPPWRGGIQLLNHSRRKLKGREIALPARAISTKNKHLLASLRYQPAVSRRLFRCLGAHLLRSPWTVNPGSKHSACFVATVGQNPPAENLGSPTPDFGLVSVTSFRCRSVSYSQRLHLSLIVSSSHWS